MNRRGFFGAVAAGVAGTVAAVCRQPQPAYATAELAAVEPGGAILVGEDGPETFMVPNQQIVVNIEEFDTAITERFARELARALEARRMAL